MKFAIISAVLAGLASAASVDLSRRNSPIDVQLEMVGNTMVKATVVNNGDQDLKVLNTGSILDDMATEKVFVSSAEQPMDFEGMHLSLATEDLEDGAFRVVRAGETVTSTFNIGEFYNLASGGRFTIKADGMFSVAEMNSSSISDAVPYVSNTLEVNVDGAEAASAFDAYHSQIRKRSKVGKCQGKQLQQTLEALKNCNRLAQQAIKGVQNRERFIEFFKEAGAAPTVTQVFQKAAQECSSSDSGTAQYFCEDVNHSCKEGTNAYTLPGQSILVNCPRWFGLPPRSNNPREKAQDTVTLHEMTHLKQIKGTSDYGTYGYEGLRKLPANKNINHADTYSLFAQSFEAGN